MCMKHCDDCGKRLWFRRYDIVAVDKEGVEVGRTLACPHCAEVWKLLDEVSKALGPDGTVALLKEIGLGTGK